MVRALPEGPDPTWLNKPGRVPRRRRSRVVRTQDIADSFGLNTSLTGHTMPVEERLLQVGSGGS